MNTELAEELLDNGEISAEQLSEAADHIARVALAVYRQAPHLIAMPTQTDGSRASWQQRTAAFNTIAGIAGEDLIKGIQAAMVALNAKTEEVEERAMELAE